MIKNTKIINQTYMLLLTIKKGIFCVIKLLFCRDKLTYGDLNLISHFSKKVFLQLKYKYMNKAIDKIGSKKKIKFGFVVYTGTMWFTDRLYQMLSNNERFSVEVIIARYGMTSSISEEENYINAKNYFENVLNYRTISPRDSDFDITSYDILFYMLPYPLDEKQINIQDVQLNTLACYLSYSYMLAENINKINLPMYRLVWMLFADSDYYNEMIKRYSHIYTQNSFYLGYPKMDEYYHMNEIIKSEERKVIIYAPHQSVHYTGVKSATFEQNYKFMLELAKMYAETTYWYVKPHPLLRDNSVKAGIFKNVEEYDKYMNEWNSLDNAEVVLQGNYLQVFKLSDAMITDSISFLAEYQFTSKPLLLLMSGKQVYNEFGQAIVDILYKCNGSDEDAVRKFIENIINETDNMADIRKKFFKKNLDYIQIFGKDSNTMIYEKIVNELIRS